MQDELKAALRCANQAFEAGMRAADKGYERRFALLMLGATEAMMLLHDGFAGKATLRLQDAIDEARR